MPPAVVLQRFVVVWMTSVKPVHGIGFFWKMLENVVRQQQNPGTFVWNPKVFNIEIKKDIMPRVIICRGVAQISGPRT